MFFSYSDKVSFCPSATGSSKRLHHLRSRNPAVPYTKVKFVVWRCAISHFMIHMKHQVPWSCPLRSRARQA